MTRADRVLSTPPTNTPISQLQMGRDDSKMTHESSTAVSGGSCVSRRSIMNMLVSTAIAGAAIPAVASQDPIYAAIDAHKAAFAALENAVYQFSDFETELH